MQRFDTDIPDVKLLLPARYEDERGFFAESYNEDKLAEALGHRVQFRQDNYSYSKHRWTMRGIHFQRPPFAQAKLLRVIRGSVLDFAVDLRKESPTFGKWVTHKISAENFLQAFVPAGFGHAILTLEPDTEILYKVSAPFAPDHASGIRWDDPTLAVDWGVDDPSKVVLSPKDQEMPTFAEAVAQL